MSLLLVRHGQASYGAADYDNLSERGHEQSRRLGDWLVRGGHRFKAVVVGGMRRHRQTAEGVAAAFAAQGLELPDAVADDGFAEFDHEAVFSTWLNRNADHPVAIASRSGKPRDVGAMLQAALLAWARDELPDLPESWSAFGQRVQSAASAASSLIARLGSLTLFSRKRGRSASGNRAIARHLRITIQLHGRSGLSTALRTHRFLVRDEQGTTQP